MRKIIGERLEEERVRLGKKKGAMAEIGGVVGSAYTNYLEGNRAPDAEFLANIAAAGADVQYILTGIRTTATSGVTEATASYVVVTKREAALLDNYRHVPKEEDKRAIDRMALLAAKADKDETKSGKKSQIKN